MMPESDDLEREAELEALAAMLGGEDVDEEADEESDGSVGTPSVTIVIGNPSRGY